MDVAHSCRCCLQRAPDKGLTTPYTHLGTTEIYSDMLKECFEIHLILDSEEEVGICDVCVGRLRDASDFKLQVQHSQIELQAWVLGAPPVKKEEPAVDSTMEVGDVSSEEPVLCEEILIKIEKLDNGTSDEEGQELSYEARAVKAEVSDEEGAEDCISLAWAGAGYANLEPARPVSARARERLSMGCSVRLERLRGDEAPHASQTCLATARRGPRLASRMEDTPDDTAGLRAEEQAYTEPSGEHITQTDKLCVTYSCKTCSKEFSCETIYTKHVNTHMNNETYTCDRCKAKFRIKARLISHIRTHDVKVRYPCEICNKTFLYKHLLERHIKIHTGKERFSCEICNRWFLFKGSLIRHIKIHTEEKPFICNECDKQFTRKDVLDTHKRMHTGVNLYSCNECDKRFTTKYELIRHIRTHTGEKPFWCNECNKRFSQKSGLNSHTKTHTGEKPFSCNECNKQFVAKGQLKTHKRIHTGFKAYSCNECDKQFTLKHHLDRHKKTHTG